MRIIPGVEPQNPTLLWLALAFRRAKQTKSYERVLKDLFAGAVNRHYHCLFAQPTLLGPRDISLLAPLVVDAGKKLKDERSVQGLASKLGLAGLSYHPGYTLRISSLGNLRVWRGQEEIGGREWQREKALELFLLLLMNRGKYLPKETLYDLLWPEEDEDTAARNFKVSLNALRKALEPDRMAQEDSYYVLRNRSNYGKGAKGHPVGATGVSMAVLATRQLQGQAIGHQVEGAKIGLTYNIGGSAASNYCLILKKN